MLKKSFRPLGVESLETRDLMAGNVMVRVVQGSLQITGDTQSNVFTVTPVSAGKVTITGIGTTINSGTTAKTFTFTKDLNVDTGAGNDRVTIGAVGKTMNLPQSSRVRMGGGADSLLVQGLVGINSTILMADKVETPDVVDIDKVTAKACRFSGTVSIALGNGDDQVNFVGCTARTGLSVDSGAGNDTTNVTNGLVGNLTLKCGDGDDTGFFSGKLKATGIIFADGGAGTDTAGKAPGTSIEISDPDPTIKNFETQGLG
jgi:hypothetical protein